MLVSIADVWGATRWCQMDFNTMFHFISVRHDPGETQDPLGQCRVSQWVRGFHLDISWQSGCQCLACRSRCIPPWICIPRSSLTNWSSSCFSNLLFCMCSGLTCAHLWNALGASGPNNSGILWHISIMLHGALMCTGPSRECLALRLPSWILFLIVW